MLHCWKKINKNVGVGTPKRHTWCVGNFMNLGYGEKMSHQLSFVFNFSHTLPNSTIRIVMQKFTKRRPALEDKSVLPGKMWLKLKTNDNWFLIFSPYPKFTKLPTHHTCLLGVPTLTFLLIFFQQWSIGHSSDLKDFIQICAGPAQLCRFLTSSLYHHFRIHNSLESY